MKIQPFFLPHLTIIQPRELQGKAEEKLDLKARLVIGHQRSGVPLHVGRSQHDVARLVRVFAIDQDDQPQLAFQGQMPGPRRVQLDVGGVGQRARPAPSDSNPGN